MGLRRLRNSFISGLLLLAPVGVTLFVLNFLISSLGRPASGWFFFYVDPSLRENPWVEIALNIVSTLIVLMMITAFGWFSSLLIGKFFLTRFEIFMSNVPFVRNVYLTVKQIIETFTQNQKAVFQKTVLVEYPRKGVFVLGFLTSDGKGEVQHRTDKEVLNVFVPTTPNPTSGFLLMVPRDEVIELEMSIADGMKLIISGGAVVPKYAADTGKATAVAASENDTRLTN